MVHRKIWSFGKTLLIRDLIFCVFIIAIAGSLLSCDTRSGNKSPGLAGFIKKDSVSIAYGGHLQLIDVLFDDHTVEYLAFDGEEKDILEFDSEGELTRRINYKDEKLSLEGASIISFAYVNDSLKFIKTQRAYNLYDDNWNLINSIKRPNESTREYLRTIERKPSIFTIDGDFILVEAKDKLEPERIYQRDFFERSKTLYWVSLTSGKVDSVIAFPRNSVYLDELFIPHFDPAFSVNPQRGDLYVFFPEIQGVFVHDYGDDFKLVKERQLTLEGFAQVQGVDYQDQSTNYNPAFGMNRDVLKIHNDGLGINYSFLFDNLIGVEYRIRQSNGKAETRMAVFDEEAPVFNQPLPKSMGRSKAVYLSNETFVFCAPRVNQSEPGKVKFYHYQIGW